MAAITFPRTLPSELRFTSVDFRLEPMAELNPLRSGLIISHNMGPDLWRMTVTSKPMTEGSAGAVRAWYHTLMSEKSFYAFDQRRQKPAAYTLAQFNALTVAGSAWSQTGHLVSVNADNKRMTITDVPVLLRLSAGDYLSFVYGDSQALHQVVAAATADSGSPGDLVDVEVRPQVRPGWSAGAVVAFYRPVAEMKIVPGSFSAPSSNLGVASFEAVQTL